MPIKFTAKSTPTAKAKPTPQPSQSLPEPSETPVAPGQAFIDLTGFAQSNLKYQLHKATAKETHPRSHKVVHMSDLDPSRNFCPREGALMDLYNFKRPMGFLSTAQAVTFDFGHAAARIIQKLLPPEKVWGNWKCLACDHEIKHEYTPTACPACKAKGRALEYREVFLKDPESGLVGSIDLFVDILSNGKKTAIEIKSEGNESFKARSKPEFDHEWRTKGYLRLIAVTPWMAGTGAQTDEARVIYVTKEGNLADDDIKKWKLKDWGKSPFKEYRVPRDDAAVQNQLDKLMTLVNWRAMHTAGVTDDLPPRICKTPSETRATNCEACGKCFQNS